MFKHTMRACLFLWILLEQILDLSASQDFHYIQRLEGELVDILCMAQHRKSQPLLLYLRRCAHLEKVFFFEDKSVRADPEIEGRIKISGQLNSRAVNVTLFNLRHTDTGLYVCEFFTDHPCDQLSVNTNLLLLVKTADEPCSCSSHSLVIYIISVGVCLLLLTVITVSAAHYKKAHAQKEPQTTIPIYEDMSSLQGTSSSTNCFRIFPRDSETPAPILNGGRCCRVTIPKRTNHVEQH